MFSKFKHRPNGARLQGEAGFSMIELLIAMALFVIVSGAIYGLMKIATTDRFSSNQQLEILQNLRVAMNAIERDALNAASGSFPHNSAASSLAALPQNSLRAKIAGLPVTPSGLDYLMPVISGNNVNPVNGVNTDQVTFVYKDPLFNNGSDLQLQWLDKNGSGGTYEATIQTGTTNNACQQNDLYLVTLGSSGNFSVFTMTNAPNGSQIVSFANTDPLNFNRTTATGGVLPSGVFNASGYYVGNNNGSGSPVGCTMGRIRMETFWVASDGTLYRRSYGYNPTGAMGSGYPGYYDEPLAYNITNMQVLYTMNDGTTTADPLAGGSLQNLQNVRQVSVTLTAQSPQIDPRNGQRVTFTVTDTFALRNLDY